MIRKSEIEAYLERCDDDVQLASAVIVAEALDNIANALHALGNADAVSPMGAIENLALELKSGMILLASAITDKNE